MSSNSEHENVTQLLRLRLLNKTLVSLKQSWLMNGSERFKPHGNESNDEPIMVKIHGSPKIRIAVEEDGIHIFESERVNTFTNEFDERNPRASDVCVEFNDSNGNRSTGIIAEDNNFCLMADGENHFPPRYSSLTIADSELQLNESIRQDHALHNGKKQRRTHRDLYPPMTRNEIRSYNKAGKQLRRAATD
jgi:hypothetical protein